LRVAYAIDSTFALHHGWIRAQRGAHVTWLTLFARAGDSTIVFFTDSATAASPESALRVSPNGPAATVRLPRGAEWTMYLDRVVGEWGEVRIDVGDICGEDTIKKLPRKFWVKLVNERGRPLVLFPNEGVC
jgi:hypothetical protein